MQIGALSWSTNNIGDDIQTVAVMQHLPPVDVFIDRDQLNTFSGPETLLVMNGWFLTRLENWPPSKSIKPIFFGFHVQTEAKPVIARHVDYLKEHAPIGCRDRGTTEFIRSLGVEAYFSYCATLTFDAPADRSADSIYFVEANSRRFIGLEKNLSGLTVRNVSHRFVAVPLKTRLTYARELVETYGRTAGYVITSRIHCAMPCVAMGIPTFFVGPRNYRTAIINDIGVPRPRSPGLVERLLPKGNPTLPPATDVSEIKRRARDDLRARIAAALAGG